MLINKLDSVEVNVENGHKYAVKDIKNGENVISKPLNYRTANEY